MSFDLTFPQPLDCPLGTCPSISMYERELARHKATEAKLRAFAIREKRLLREKDELIQQKDMLAKESEHRLLNGLQLITSLLTLQSRAAKNEEVSAELKIAANRVATLGRVHQHLHALDHVESVAFKQYLEKLCHDLANIVSSEGSERILVVEGNDLKISSVKAIPLGFIASELLTNSIKYAKGRITVRLETTSNQHYVLSVSDDGPGLPDGFDPADTQGLGMKLVSALVKQIGGELHISKGDNGQGSRFSVLFS
jgi:two-component system, sensor histidine kinase PdtaS